MRGMFSGIIVGVATVLLSVPVLAQGVPAPPSPGSSGGATATTNEQGAAYDFSKVSAPGVNQIIPEPLVYENAPVTEVLNKLAQWGGVNIVAQPEITDEDRVTVNLRNVPWKQAFNLVLDLTRPNKLTVESESISLIVVAKPPRVTASFKNAPLTEVIQTLAEYKGASVVISPEVKGTITFSFRDVPWNSALEQVVRTAGFAIVQQPNNIIQVVHPRELTAQLETRIFQLKHIRPRSTYVPKIDSNFVDRETKRAAASRGKTATERFLLEFPFLDFLTTTLSKSLEGDIVGTLKYDDQTNTIMIKDTKPVLDKVQSIIDELDVEPSQVMIDVKFISTTNENILNFGTNYAQDDSEGFIFRSQAIDPNTTATSPNLTGGKRTRLPFGLGAEMPTGDQLFLTQYQFIATLRLFQRDRFSKLIQAPQLTALDNQEATIFVGETIYFAQAESESGQSGGTSFTIAEADNSPISVGFQLFLIPHVVKGTDKVMMTVIPENTFLSGTSADAAVPGFNRFEVKGAGAGGADLSIDLPQVSAATVATNMILESGQTALLGGLIVERTNKDVKKIPVLGDIPLVNFLFRSTNDSVTKDHLIIFLTPRVIKPIAEVQSTLDNSLQNRRSTQDNAFKGIRESDGSQDPFYRGMQERRDAGSDEFDKLMEDTGEEAGK